MPAHLAAFRDALGISDGLPVPLLSDVPFAAGTVAWCVLLFFLNWVLAVYTRDTPSSALSAEVGPAATPAHRYVVAVTGQALIVPACFAHAVLSREHGWREWWFAAPDGSALSGMFVYLCAFYVADLVARWHASSPLLKLHHVACAMACVAAERTASWRGLSMFTALTFQLGSLARNLADLGCIPPRLAEIVYIEAMAVPLVWIAHGFVSVPPKDLWGWYLIAGAMGGGWYRIGESIIRLRACGSDAPLDPTPQQDPLPAKRQSSLVAARPAAPVATDDVESPSASPKKTR